MICGDCPLLVKGLKMFLIVLIQGRVRNSGDDFPWGPGFIPWFSIRTWRSGKIVTPPGRGVGSHGPRETGASPREDRTVGTIPEDVPRFEMLTRDLVCHDFERPGPLDVRVDVFPIPLGR